MDLEIEKNNSNLLFNNDDFKLELSNSLKNTIIYFSIDRFEGDFAICENLESGEFENIPLNLIPENSKEGDILKFENNIFSIDKEKTNQEQEEIKNMVDNLFKKKS